MFFLYSKIKLGADKNEIKMMQTLPKKIMLGITTLLCCGTLSYAQPPQNVQDVLSSVLLAVSKTEESADHITRYYYQDAAQNELVLAVAQEFIHVSWSFKKSPNEASVINQQVQMISKKLLGEEWQSLYSAITEGGTVDYLSQEDGTIITDATCSDTQCGYQVRLEE